MKLSGNLFFIIDLRTSVSSSVGTVFKCCHREAQNELTIHATCILQNFASHLPIYVCFPSKVLTTTFPIF